MLNLELGLSENDDCAIRGNKGMSNWGEMGVTFTEKSVSTPICWKKWEDLESDEKV